MFSVLRVRALVNSLIFEVIISGWYAEIIKPNGALSSLRSQGFLSRPSKFEAFIHIIYSEGRRCMYLVLLFEALLKNSNEEST